LIGAVVCVVAAALRSRTIGSCQSTATSYDCTARLVAASPRNIGLEESDLYLFKLWHKEVWKLNTVGWLGGWLGFRKLNTASACNSYVYLLQRS